MESTVNKVAKNTCLKSYSTSFPGHLAFSMKDSDRKAKEALGTRLKVIWSVTLNGKIVPIKQNKMASYPS